MRQTMPSRDQLLLKSRRPLLLRTTNPLLSSTRCRPTSQTATRTVSDEAVVAAKARARVVSHRGAAASRAEAVVCIGVVRTRHSAISRLSARSVRRVWSLVVAAEGGVGVVAVADRNSSSSKHSSETTKK